MGSHYRSKNGSRKASGAVRISDDIMAQLKEYAEQKRTSIGVAADILLLEVFQKRRELESMDLGRS